MLLSATVALLKAVNPIDRHPSIKAASFCNNVKIGLILMLIASPFISVKHYFLLYLRFLIS
ncbi:Rod shape-determining protein RodA [uncultured Gammaproteobacteria bacterium]|nr:Rod shape-determining protein RodA [uncultured Gammaproteobacteria bacterium]